MVTLNEISQTDTRARLIEAAADAFYTKGYACSMEAIAVRAGVAKQTLYNHFPSKDQLFTEVILRDSESMMTALVADEGDLRERLLRFSCIFRELVFGPRCIALYRTLIAEASRFPEMISAFYETGPARTIRELASLLEMEMSAGRLRRDGPEAALFAADMLLGMLTGSERKRYLLGVEKASLENDRPRVERIVDTFLRAYAVDASLDRLPPSSAASK